MPPSKVNSQKAKVAAMWTANSASQIFEAPLVR
jgi:hypothetical protein